MNTYITRSRVTSIFAGTLMFLAGTAQVAADGFRITSMTGEVLGVRTLFHDHQSEQPFTRDLYAVKIPKGLKTVIVQARDQKNGYGGKSVEVVLPGR